MFYYTIQSRINFDIGLHLTIYILFVNICLLDTFNGVSMLHF